MPASMPNVSTSTATVTRLEGTSNGGSLPNGGLAALTAANAQMAEANMEGGETLPSSSFQLPPEPSSTSGDVAMEEVSHLNRELSAEHLESEGQNVQFSAITKLDVEEAASIAQEQKARLAMQPQWVGLEAPVQAVKADPRGIEQLLARMDDEQPPVLPSSLNESEGYISEEVSGELANRIQQLAQIPSEETNVGLDSGVEEMPLTVMASEFISGDENPESDGALIATVQAQGARDGDDSAGILGEKAGSAIGEPNNQVTGLSVSDNSLNQGGRVDNDLRYAGQELLDSPSQTSSVLAPQSVISREASKTSTYSATLSSNTHLAEETAFSDTASLHADKSAKALTSANSSDAAVDNTLTASADSDLLDASDNKVSILGDSEEALLGSVSTVPNAPQASPTGLVRSAGEPTQPPVQQAPLRGNEQALAAQANLPVDDGSASMSDGMADKMDITKSIEGTAKVLDVAQQTANQQSARTPATQVAAAMTLAGQGKMGSNEWAQGLSQRVMVMTSQNNQFAEIQLDPPELGALRVKVQVTQEGVNVNFSSVHASVRDAVEQSIPRLREMMAEQGLSLGESSVSDESEQQAAHASQEEGLGGGGTEQNTMDDGHDDDVNELVNMAQPTGLVDFYA